MAERKADPATYARVFEHGDGALILEHLKHMFTQKLFHKGGEDGRRLTDFSLGANAVVDHIQAQIRLASTPVHDDDTDSQP